MAEEVRKEYTNGDLTVVWKPKLCIHSEICVKTLPKVYHPKEKPWIQPENASKTELKSQISKCPSGALSYEMKNGEEKETVADPTKVDVLENGPLLVHGSLLIKTTNGNEELKDKTTAFCRCGQSNNKPYCDGTHTIIEFKG